MLLDIESKYGSCNETYLGEGKGSAGAPRSHNGSRVDAKEPNQKKLLVVLYETPNSKQSSSMLQFCLNLQ